MPSAAVIPKENELYRLRDGRYVQVFGVGDGKITICRQRVNRPDWYGFILPSEFEGAMHIPGGEWYSDEYYAKERKRMMSGDPLVPKTHKKRVATTTIGGDWPGIVCGSRKVRLDAIDADGMATVSITRKKGETVATQAPHQRDNPWIGPDPGEGEMVTEQYEVRVGDKLRIGSYRQFRILGVDGTNAKVAVVGPVAEIDT